MTRGILIAINKPKTRIDRQRYTTFTNMELCMSVKCRQLFFEYSNYIIIIIVCECCDKTPFPMQFLSTLPLCTALRESSKKTE